MKWDALQSEVLTVAATASSVQSVIEYLRGRCDEPVSRDALDGAWRRWRDRDPSLPALPEYVGHLTRASVPHVVQPAPEPLLVVPSESKPPPEPPDHHVADTGETPRLLLCDGDNHHPIQDPYVEAAKLAFARDVKPDVWVNTGDDFDCWLISKHDKEPARIFDGRATLQREFDSARPYWTEVCRIASRVHLILGNHEHRLGRLIGANLGLFGLRALEWQLLAGLPDRVQVHQYGARLRVGAMTFEHGDRIGGRFGIKHAAAWLLDNRGSRNTIFGHSHRVETRYRTVWDEHGEPHSYVAINNGHGSDVAQQKYAPDPDWTHAITLVEYWTEAGKPRFTAHPIPIINGRFSFGGRTYDGHKSQ